MKALMEQIREELDSKLSYVRSGDLYFTEDIEIIPAHVKFPAIGIKDGSIEREKHPGNTLWTTCSVFLVIYVKIEKPGASIMGDSATGAKGVLEIDDDIFTVLDENYLGIAGMQWAEYQSSDESELVGDENETLQRKVVRFKYIKEETLS